MSAVSGEVVLRDEDEAMSQAGLGKIIITPIPWDAQLEGALSLQTPSGWLRSRLIARSLPVHVHMRETGGRDAGVCVHGGARGD